jgi:hypothetical protein
LEKVKLVESPDSLLFLIGLLPAMALGMDWPQPPPPPPIHGRNQGPGTGRQELSKRVTNRHEHKGVLYLSVICHKASRLISDFYTKLRNVLKKEPIGITINVNNWDQKQPHLKSA